MTCLKKQLCLKNSYDVFKKQLYDVFKKTAMSCLKINSYDEFEKQLWRVKKTAMTCLKKMKHNVKPVNVCKTFLIHEVWSLKVRVQFFCETCLAWSNIMYARIILNLIAVQWFHKPEPVFHSFRTVVVVYIFIQWRQLPISIFLFLPRI